MWNVLIATILWIYLIPCYCSIKDGYLRIELIRENDAWFNPDKRFYYSLDAEPRTNDSIQLMRYMDNVFYGEIVIGHRGQKMKVVFSTAWSTTWFLSLKCQLKPGCKNHNLYDHDKSTYYKPNGTKYVADTGTYNLTGFFSYENISFAHSNVTNFLFAEMVDVPDSYQNELADGVIGLGLKDDDDEYGYEPFFYALVREKKIKNNLFSVFINRDSQSNKGGNILLGYIDPKHIHKSPDGKVQDPITYLNVDPGPYWMFNMDKITITSDKKPINYTRCAKGCKAVVDTSSNLIIGPPDDVQFIYDMINAQKYNDQWVINCDRVKKLPKITFTLANKPFVIGGEQYIMKISNVTQTTCAVAFQATETPTEDDMWILGGAFLGQYYSIYNVADRKIGFVRTP